MTKKQQAIDTLEGALGGKFSLRLRRALVELSLDSLSELAKKAGEQAQSLRVQGSRDAWVELGRRAVRPDEDE